jgi:uncharacterized Zn-binding protein involved in type VI secretion
MLPLIRVGDPLSPHGGEVLQGSFMAFGKPVACVGDQARCDKHGLTHIVAGGSSSTMNGKAVALDGLACACGCRLVSTLSSGSMQVTP